LYQDLKGVLHDPFFFAVGKKKKNVLRVVCRAAHQIFVPALALKRRSEAF
jgi:hypothetical protein